MTHLDFRGGEAGAAVHSLQSDGVELAFVQVNHGQLTGLVGRSHRSSQGKLELIPESLWWRAGVGARVDRAGLVIREGIAIGKSLKFTKRHLFMTGKRERTGATPHGRTRETGLHLGAGIGEAAGQQGVEDDVELLLVVGVRHHAGQGGVGVGGGGGGVGQ